MITETTTIFVAEPPSHGPQGGRPDLLFPLLLVHPLLRFALFPQPDFRRHGSQGPYISPLTKKWRFFIEQTPMMSYLIILQSPILIPNHSTLLSGCASAQPVLHWHLTRRTPWKTGYPGSKYIRNTVCEANYTFTTLAPHCTRLLAFHNVKTRQSEVRTGFWGVLPG